MELCPPSSSNGNATASVSALSGKAGAGCSAPCPSPCLWMLSLACLFILSACSQFSSTGSEDLGEEWQSLRQTAFEAFRDQRFDQAENAYREAVAAAEKFGRGDLRAGVTYNDLARVYLARRNDAAAEDAFKRALKSIQEGRGAGGARSAAPEGISEGDVRVEALCGLAAIASRRMHRAEARDFYKQALTVPDKCCSPAAREMVHFEYQHFLREKTGSACAGSNSPQQGQMLPDDVLTGSRDFQLPENYLRAAEAAMSRRDYGEAERMSAFAIDAARRRADVKGLAAALEEMGLSCLAGGKPDKCAIAFGKAAKIYEKARLADSEGHIFSCWNTMGLAYLRMGKPSEARIMYKNVLKRFDAALGAGTPARAEAVENLAAAYIEEHNWAASAGLLEQCLSIRDKCGTVEDPAYVRVGCRLINVYNVSGRALKADALLQRISAALASPGRAHDVRAGLQLVSAGESCLQEGRTAEARKYSQAALKVLQSFPRETDAAARVWCTLGCVASRGNNVSEAIDCQLRAIALFEKADFPSRPGLASSCLELGTAYGATRQFAKAEMYLQRAMAENEKAHVADLLLKSRCQHRLGVVYQQQGRVLEAEKLYRKAVAIGKEMALPETAEYMFSYAGLLAATGRTAEGQEMAARARAIVGAASRDRGS